jgi:predicted dienelactone hydrolase
VEIVIAGFRVPIAVEDLSRFAAADDARGDLKAYLAFLSGPEREQLRRTLTEPLAIEPSQLRLIVQNSVGQQLLAQLGTIIRTANDENGGSALGNALVVTSHTGQGISPLGILQAFPSPTLRLNIDQALALSQEVRRLFQEQEKFLKQLQERQNGLEKASAPTADLSRRGPYTWKRTSLSWLDAKRDRPVPVDLLLPSKPGVSPLVLFSHGFASNRRDLDYLAEHLASHGYAVALVEHIGSNSERFQGLLTGLASPPLAREAIDRPLDLSFVLDQLTRDASLARHLNLEAVAVLGHSYGGYTALASAGAQLDGLGLQRFCRDSLQRFISLNLSMLLQCQVAEVTPLDQPLGDRRIRAVVALNPITSRLFGQAGLRQLRVPTLLVGSSADLVTPLSDEQLQPFTWLRQPNRYLAILDRGSHFSALQGGNGPAVFNLPPSFVGPDQRIAHRYLRVLVLAFLESHLRQQAEAEVYLRSNYAKLLSQAAMPLLLVRDLKPTDIAQVVVGDRRAGTLTLRSTQQGTPP